MIPCRSNKVCDWFMTTGERQLQFQSRYHMGRNLTLPLCLFVLAGNNGAAFTPWVALPGEYTPKVHQPILPGTPPCRVEATNRSKGSLTGPVVTASASEPVGREFYPGLRSYSVLAIICNDLAMQARPMVTSRLALTCCKLVSHLHTCRDKFADLQCKSAAN
ncbi:hypothetical protein AVEN_35258-1 [Araneus ventricosus]|uniref:Uncharacterized protein n=1 Tax=Araneus ventricosus TaxID=182803 RepID=A0A4Y2EI84_ARAVE|nr:hypothetical protein AVEN_35258-1 [Araneus ventricosus]